MQDTKKHEWLQKLITIQQAGKLGELLERFAYEKRNVANYDALYFTHAELDAGNIGRAAGVLLAVDEDEMAEVAIEALAPDRHRQLGQDLIDELLAEIGEVTQPVVVPIQPAPVPAPQRSLAW